MHGASCEQILTQNCKNSFQFWGLLTSKAHGIQTAPQCTTWHLILTFYLVELPDVLLQVVSYYLHAYSEKDDGYRVYGV